MSFVPDLFQRAVQFHQSGNLAQAEPLYRQVLQADPRHAEAHHLLGLLAHQTGHQEPAIALLRQAIALNPAADGAHFNLGIVLMNQKQYSDAAQCFRLVLQLNPNHVEAHINLGNALLNQGQLPEAITFYRQALRLQPLHADAHINLGNALMNQGKNDEAIACYQDALRINPRHAPGFNNLGNALLGQGKLNEAAQCYRQALSLDPASAKAHFNLGNVFKDQGQLAQAADCFRQALRIQPDHAGAHNNLGIILQDQGQIAEAALCYRQALRLNPNNMDAYNNLGNAFKEQGQIDQAAECFQQALNIDPGHALVLWNRSLLRLLQGDLAEGWTDYELRWTQPGMVQRPFVQPRWDGSSLQGKTILVHAEQGLGDSIHFLRYLPMVQGRGGTVLFECQPSLFRLLGNIKGVDRLIAAGTPLPPFDVQAPLMSLPGIFGTTLATIPAAIPYLAADPGLVDHWRQEIGRAARCEPAGLKIGIAWQGDLKHKGYGNRTLANRSLSLANFGPLARVENVQLLSLQVGQGAEQVRAAAFPVTDLGSRFDPNSLEDLAAVLKTLDLVVTVDTAVAHLAGALGVPVWVALPVGACWRWLLNRSDSPWYPTMRLFRQKKYGDWGEVFERIAAELQHNVHYNLGIVLMNRGQLVESAQCFRQALKLNPGNVEAHIHLGNTLMHQGQSAEAIACYRQALCINPQHASAHYNLGTALLNQKELTQAIPCFRAALSSRPDYAHAHLNLGNALMEQGQLAEAAECFRQELRLNPNQTEANNNLGNALVGQGLLADGADCFKKAIAIDPGDKVALWNRSLLRLRQGDFEGGWPDFEQHSLMPGAVPRSFQQPRWDGRSLKGKTILVFAQRGLGDTIQFVRFLPLVKARGGTVLFECAEGLISLMEGIAGVDQFLAAGKPLPRFDVQAPLLSLPGILGTTLQTIPADVPYLRADPALVEFWRQELNSLDGFKIGIAWQGNPLYPADKFRSIPFHHFEKLARVPKVRLVSLQKGPGCEQIQAGAERIPILELGDRLDAKGAFLDTAAIMMNLDLVVTVDTAIEHLAGALGVPVWTVLWFVPDWRWFLDRDDSPWYPTMRLFRQKQLGDWNEVFDRIAAAVKNGGSQ